MSYIFPIVVAKTTQSNSMLGIIMALSSVLGIICDFIFPSLLTNRSWRFQLIVGIVIAMLFPIVTNLGAVYSLVFFLILASLIWGVYYEFLQFSQQSFVIHEDSKNRYSKDWGIIYLIYDATIIVGPIIGSFLITQHVVTSNITINAFQIISLLFALLVMINIPRGSRVNSRNTISTTIHVIRQLTIWEKFGERVWPVILTGVTMSFVNASFWTIGGLLGLEITNNNGFDWIVMVLYGIPLILGALLLTRLSIEKRKKHVSHLALFAGGLCLFMIAVVKSSPIIVLSCIFLAGFSFSFVGPLNEAVYSDLLKRSGKSKLHLLGIAKSNASLAYILAPLFTGFVSDILDYSLTLSIVGGITIVVASILLLFSPRKVKLPQHSLQVINSDIVD